MYYVYYEFVSNGKQEYCGQYETVMEAVKRVATLYARDADLGQNGEYYYFIKKH